MSNQYSDLNKSLNKNVWALCPRCHMGHIVNIYWTGRGIPRIYCGSCESSVGYIKDYEYSLPDLSKQTQRST